MQGVKPLITVRVITRGPATVLVGSVRTARDTVYAHVGVGAHSTLDRHPEPEYLFRHSYDKLICELSKIGREF